MAKDLPRRRTLPLLPLLAQYRAAPPRATELEPPLRPDDIDTAPDDRLVTDLSGVALPVAFHPGVFAREVRFLRHALAHLFRGHDPLPERLARCVTPGEAY